MCKVVFNLNATCVCVFIERVQGKDILATPFSNFP